MNSTLPLPGKESYPFPGMFKHKLQHASFTETVQDIRWQYLHGFRPRINREVLLFLRDWLSKHILVEDMKYAVAISTQEYGHNNNGGQ